MEKIEPDQTQWLSIAGQPLNLDTQANIQGRCVPVDSFEKLNQLGEGTYGIVYRARDRQISDIVALKQVRIPTDERQNGVPITALREISILRSLRHNNIVNVIDVAVGEKSMSEVYMVMDYAEQDLATMLDELQVKFTMSQGKDNVVVNWLSSDHDLVKCLFRQLLQGLEYLHKNEIIHRDVKMQNILLMAKGVLKLADFGMARAYSPRPLTPGVVTIWYRAPEILLGTKRYTPSIDIWSASLVLAELLLSAPCLPGETPLDQLSLITKLLGSPTPDDLTALSTMGCPDLIRWRREGFSAGRADNIERRFLPGSSPETVTYIKGLLRWDPHARWTATEALGLGRSRLAAVAERWWKESPRAVEKELLPTYPEVRNKAEKQRLADQSKDMVKNLDDGSAAEAGYVFDFGDGEGVHRPPKRPRAR